MSAGCSQNGAMLFHVTTEKERRWLRATADALRAERGIANLSQAEMARRTGISRSSYRLYEDAVRSPTAVQLALIAATLGKSFGSLLAEIERRAEEG